MRFHYRIRRFHRWLGLLISIQLLAWTVSGLYFSWSDMDEVHGDHEKAPVPLLSIHDSVVYPTKMMQQLISETQVDSFAELKLINILNQPHWQLAYYPAGYERHHRVNRLANAVTGALRAPLSEEESVMVAKSGYAGSGKVLKTAYLTEVNAHHEYREQPLPAWAVTFDDERHSTVYVSTELGTVQKIRNQPWRRFDFLWMLHTMDYQSRDNITNWLLRIFSILGVVTVCSGLMLFWVSRKRPTIKS